MYGGQPSKRYAATLTGTALRCHDMRDLFHGVFNMFEKRFHRAGRHLIRGALLTGVEAAPLPQCG